MSLSSEPGSFAYSVFGLRLQTDRRLAGLVPLLNAGGRLDSGVRVDTRVRLKADTTYDLAGADVKICFEGFPQWAIDERSTAAEPWYVNPVKVDSGRPATTVWKLAGGYLCLELADGIGFLVDPRGCEAWVALPAASAFDEAVSHVLGPILGLVLRLRGTTCLHASAISVHGQAIAFAGPQGVGKSTLAAAFAMRGCSILSDDVVALADRGHTILAQPGYPRLCLRPQFTACLQEMSGQSGALTPDWDGEHVSLDLTAPGYTFQPEPMPLAVVYFLVEPSADASHPRIESISGRDALMRLVGDTWATRLLDPSMRAAELDLLSRLIAQLRVRLVHPHTDPARLSRLCDLIIEDVEQGR